MKFLVNRKLATRIGIVTTVIIIAGMLSRLVYCIGQCCFNG